MQLWMGQRWELWNGKGWSSPVLRRQRRRERRNGFSTRYGPIFTSEQR